MGALMAQAQAMQAQLAAAQASLATMEVTGSAAGSLVTARMSGKGELIAVTIDPSVADPQDTATLSDLVVAAVRDAQRQVSDAAEQALGPLAGGLAALGF
jgi:nucleoid-associated protein EbfC